MPQKTIEERRAYHRAWSAKHREQKRHETNSSREADKAFVWTYYGNKCNHCGLRDIRVLQLDHINRDLRKTSRWKRGGKGLYAALRRGEFSMEDFQLLCANCNWIKRYENKEITQREFNIK